MPRTNDRRKGAEHRSGNDLPGITLVASEGLDQQGKKESGAVGNREQKTGGTKGAEFAGWAIWRRRHFFLE